VGGVWGDGSFVERGWRLEDWSSRGRLTYGDNARF
jgi:hypothetical protein